LQLFFARKQAQFCACCFYVSFDFHHFSQIEITICNLSVPWFKVVSGTVVFRLSTQLEPARLVRT
jgi:hypothetical protein